MEAKRCEMSVQVQSFLIILAFSIAILAIVSRTKSCSSARGELLAFIGVSLRSYPFENKLTMSKYPEPAFPGT